MAKKKESTVKIQPTTKTQPTTETTVLIKPQRLLVGVNFCREGAEETRIEAGLIEAGTLPPAFERLLIERGQLKFL